MSDLERELEQECEHDWKRVVDWEGDPSIPNGTHSFTYYVCRKCGEEDWENEFDHNDDDYDEPLDYDGFDL